MANYLDQGGNVGGSMYRRQPFTYIGNTKLTSPFKLNYDIFNAQPMGMSTAPGIGTYQSTYEGLDVTGQRMNMEAAFPNMADQWIAGAGNRQFPTNAQSNQVYEDTQGGRWMFITDRGASKWVPMTQNMHTGVWELPQFYQAGNLTQEQINQTTSLRAQQDQAKARIQQIWDQYFSNGRMERGPDAPQSIKNEWSRLNELVRDLESQIRNIGLNPPKRAIEEPSMFSPAKQMENVMKSIDTGELSITNEEGVLDTTALREQGDFGNWLANALEESYKTGNLEGDFYQTDENGNIVRDPETGKALYTPEFQTMVDYVTNGTPEDRERWNQYRREQAAYALSQGQTINSGYYQDAIAQDVVGRAAQASEQVSQYITKEITAQYEYVSNSLANAFRQMGILTDEEGFINKMKTAYDTIMQEYEQGIRKLAQQVAEQRAARRGDVFSSIISGILHSIMTFI